MEFSSKRPELSGGSPYLPPMASSRQESKLSQGEITVPGATALTPEILAAETAENQTVSEATTESTEVRPKIHAELDIPEGPPVAVSRYDYSGPIVEEHPEVVPMMDRHLRTTELHNTAQEISDHTYTERSEAAQRCVARLGARLGVDLSDRLVGPERFHFYTPEQYQIARGGSVDVSESQASQYGDGQEVATNTASGHILASIGESTKDTLGNANHELVHVLSYQNIGIVTETDEQGPIIIPTRNGCGYSDESTGMFDGLTEALTEITNIDLMRNEWPQEETLASLTDDKYRDLGYSNEVILISDILTTRFDDPKAALQVLQQGLLTGNKGNLRILEEAVGAKGMEVIARLSNIQERIALTAEALGMSDTARKIREDDRTGLLDWL